MALTRQQIQERLGEIKEKALYIKGIVDERANNERSSRSSGGSSGGSSSSSRVTSSSRDARNDEDGLRDEIEDNLRKQQRDLDRQIERERRALERRVEEERGSINNRFNDRRDLRQDEQTVETGATSVSLARAGGYLGGSASQQGVLQRLSDVQQREMNSLENAREDALRAANGAYEDRDFDLARESLEFARDIEQEIYNRQLDFDDRNASRFERERVETETLDFQNQIFDAIEGGAARTPEDIFEAVGGDIPLERINEYLEQIGTSPTSAEDDFSFNAAAVTQLLGAGMGQDDIQAFAETVNETGYTDDLRNNLTSAQRAVADRIFRALEEVKPGAGTSPGGGGNMLDALDLKRLEEVYGVTFPFGVTAAEVAEFFRQNPNASPDEMQAAINEFFGEEAVAEAQEAISGVDGNTTFGGESAGSVPGGQIEISEEWFRANLSKTQLKKLADVVDASAWWSSKGFDIDRMFEKDEFFNLLTEKIETARQAGFSDYQILLALTQ